MAAGDQKAVETFYRNYFPWLLAQARQSTGRDESFCLDVVQDAVLRIIRTVRTVRSEEQFKAWLRLVIRTTAWDRLRIEARQKKREAFVPTTCPADPVEETDDHERIAWLRKQLEHFDPELVRMIELRFEQRWTLAKIGQLFGLSIGTIDGRLRRAINDLKVRALEDFDD